MRRFKTCTNSWSHSPRNTRKKAGAITARTVRQVMHTHTHTHTHTPKHTPSFTCLSLTHKGMRACGCVCARDTHPLNTLSHTKRLKSNYIHTYVHTYIHTYMQTDRQTQQGVTGAAPLCHLPSIVTEVSHIGHHMSKSVKQSYSNRGVSYSNRGVSYRASHEQEREAVIRRRRPPLTSFPHRKR